MVRSVVEDDFHHFRVEVAHFDGRVTAVCSESSRFPYSLCPAAGSRLSEFVGRSLTPRISDLSATIDVRSQCTHQFDIAALAIAAAARGTVQRRYDAVVEDEPRNARRARLWRDSVQVCDWTLDNRMILSPAGLAGVSIDSGFTSHIAANFDPELAEAALVLRRAVFISSGRSKIAQLDAIRHAPPHSGCWVSAPGRAGMAIRMRASTHDFTGRHHDLTADDDDWLAFAVHLTGQSGDGDVKLA